MVKKDYVKIVKAKDAKAIADEKKQIKRLQAAELYPRNFDFPLTLQFELTTHCNLFCKRSVFYTTQKLASNLCFICHIKLYQNFNIYGCCNCYTIPQIQSHQRGASDNFQKLYEQFAEKGHQGPAH